jgi:uncharacterized protein
MHDNYLQYDKLVEQALKGVVRSSLEIVRKHGLSGGHHFYITFNTQHPQVQVPPYLREKYPDEMTIVLQYQFYNLEVDEQKFSVSLSFNNVQEHLVVPLAAISGFADPSVKFGLQFHTRDPGEDEDGAEIHALEKPGKPNKPATPTRKPSARKKDGKDAKDKAATDDNNVVSLDSFRKK